MKSDGQIARGLGDMPAHPALQATPTMSCAVLIVAVVLSASVEISSGIDTDNDGMSDVWQMRFSVPQGTGSSDNDKDGMVNWRESQFGTDPNKYTPQPTAHLDGESFSIRWTTVVGVRYQVQTAADSILHGWQDTSGSLIGTGHVIEQMVETRKSSSIRRFARLKALPPLDFDGDGLDAMEEGMLGTSDGNPDSDGDHIPDYLEFSLGLNPASSVSLDGDLLPDDWERARIGNLGSTSSDDPDSDGFTVGDEFAFDLSPLTDDFANGAGVRTSDYTFDRCGQLRAVAGTLPENFGYDEEGNIQSIH